MIVTDCVYWGYEYRVDGCFNWGNGLSLSPFIMRFVLGYIWSDIFAPRYRCTLRTNILSFLELDHHFMPLILKFCKR